MTLETLIQIGWGYHDTESERLATELETADLNSLTNAHLAPLLQLSNHTIGETMGKWERASAFGEKVLQHAGNLSPDENAYVQLAVARYMNDEITGAHSAELQALRQSNDAMSTYIKTKALLASALAHTNEPENTGELLREVNAFGRFIEMEGEFNRALAITNNNLATDLVEHAELSRESVALMVDCAEAALFFWKRCGTWENEERALYLLTLVSNRNQQFQLALDYSAQALQVIAANGEEEVDEAFIRLAAAKAHRGLANEIEFKAELARADAIAGQWTDQDLIDWYKDEKSK